MASTTSFTKQHQDNDEEEIILDTNALILAPADLLLGIKYTFASNKKVIGEMKIAQHHLQPMSILHGGISCVLAESVGSLASNLTHNINNNKDSKNNIQSPTTAMVGLSLVANHLRPGKPSDTVIATALPLFIGFKTHIWDIELKSKKYDYIICSARLTTHITTLNPQKHNTQFLTTQNNNNNNNNNNDNDNIFTTTNQSITTVSSQNQNDTIPARL